MQAARAAAEQSQAAQRMHAERERAESQAEWHARKRVEAERDAHERAGKAALAEQKAAQALRARLGSEEELAKTSLLRAQAQQHAQAAANERAQLEVKVPRRPRRAARIVAAGLAAVVGIAYIAMHATSMRSPEAATPTLKLDRELRSLPHEPPLR